VDEGAAGPPAPTSYANQAVAFCIKPLQNAAPSHAAGKAVVVVSPTPALCRPGLARRRSFGGGPGTLLARAGRMSGDPVITRAGGRQLSEQQLAAQQFRTLAKPYRFRVEADAQGFPIIPGWYGRMEGVRRHQTGDTEMRAIFPPGALERVAAVIRARQKRTRALTREPQDPGIQSYFAVPGAAFGGREGQSVDLVRPTPKNWRR
jgi:hypothetical protein